MKRIDLEEQYHCFLEGNFIEYRKDNITHVDVYLNEIKTGEFILEHYPKCIHLQNDLEEVLRIQGVKKIDIPQSKGSGYGYKLIKIAQKSLSNSITKLYT